MKLLIIGSAKLYALESFYLKHLTELKHEVRIFPASDIFHSYYHKSLLNKVAFRIGWSNIYKKINKELLTTLKESSFDAILVFKGMELYPSTIDKIKAQKIFIANYNPDHPFHFYGRGSGNSNMTRSLTKYDLHITYNKKIKERIEYELNIPCEWISFGFEPSSLQLPTETEEIKRACFIGFADNERSEVVKQLSIQDIPIDVYGPNWSDFFKPSENISIFPSVYNEEMNKVALKYRIQLNLFRPHNKDSHNMRSFEMPGIGCIMLAPNSAEHQLFFDNGKEVFLYNSIEELPLLINKILQLPFDEASEIRKTAIKRSIVSKYTYADRAEQLISLMTKHLHSSH